LVLVFGFVAEMSVAISRLISLRPRVDVARNEKENLELLKPHISKRTIRRVDMLEYSAASVYGLIAELVTRGASLRILIKHPDTVGPSQRDRILMSIDQLERFVLKDHPGRVEIRCYKAAASLRGRRIDNVLVDVGWYTPDISREGVADKMEIVGHANPLVMCTAATEEGQNLLAMFDQVFESLWESARDHDVSVVTRRHEQRA
jgi:hypothetical protein